MLRPALTIPAITRLVWDPKGGHAFFTIIERAKSVINTYGAFLGGFSCDWVTLIHLNANGDVPRINYMVL